MKTKTKAEVLRGIIEKQYTVQGKEYTKFEMNFGTDGRGRKIRASRATLKSATDYVNEYYRRRKNVGDAVTALNASQLYDAREAFAMLAEAGINRSLSDTVRKFIENELGGVCISSKSIGAAYQEYYDSTPVIQKHHRRAITNRVRPWVLEFGAERDISEVTAKELADYLAPFKSTAPTTYNNKLCYIKTFLRWCVKDEHKYLKDNPIAGIQKDRIVYAEPKYLAVGDYERLVRALEARKDGKQVMNYIALNYMCGVRREEITRMREEAPRCVLLDEGAIRVSKPKGWTQGRKPRMFSMPPNAEAWLKWGWDGKGELCKDVSYIYDIIDKTAKTLGINIPKNAGRHTFITMHVAAYETPETTDHMTGTSGNMRSNHYQGLTTRQEGQEFFGIMPLDYQHTEQI